MATYTNDLRLKEIGTGDEDGTWGTSTNTNLSLIADAFSYGTKQLAADSNETFTIPDGTADATRGLYLKLTSAGSLTATRTVTLAPNTVSKVWIIENATTGGQSIAISQGSGSNVTIANGSKAFIYTDGGGASANVVDANPTAAAGGSVTSVNVSGGTTGLTTTGGPVTGSGTITIAGTLAVANGGTGGTSSTGTGNVVLSSSPALSSPSLTTPDIGTPSAGTLTSCTGLPISTGVSGLGTGVATFLATPSSANLASAVTDETGSGALVFGTSPTISGPTVTGVAAFTGITEEYATLISGTSVTANMQLATNFSLTLGHNVTTFNFSNPASSGQTTSFTLRVVQGAGPFTITWPATVDWAAATAPTLSTGSGNVDIFVFMTSDGGTTWYGFTAGQDMS